MNFLIDINHAIDTGKYKLSVEEIEEVIENGKLLLFLKRELGDDIDLSLWGPEYSQQEEKDIGINLWKNAQQYKNELTERLQSLLNAYGSQKFGVQNNGLCLLVVYTSQLIMDELRSLESR